MENRIAFIGDNREIIPGVVKVAEAIVETGFVPAGFSRRDRHKLAAACKCAGYWDRLCYALDVLVGGNWQVTQTRDGDRVQIVLVDCEAIGERLADICREYWARGC